MLVLVFVVGGGELRVAAGFVFFDAATARVVVVVLVVVVVGAVLAARVLFDDCLYGVGSDSVFKFFRLVLLFQV